MEWVAVDKTASVVGAEGLDEINGDGVDPMSQRRGMGHPAALKR